MRPAFLLLLFCPALAWAADSLTIPTGKLPAGVAPEHYSLDFRIDPRQARFAGSGEIRVRLNEGSDRIWLHAQGIDLRSTTATDAAGKAIPVHAVSHDKEGVLELRFASRIPA